MRKDSAQGGHFLLNLLEFKNLYNLKPRPLGRGGGQIDLK